MANLFYLQIKIRMSHPPVASNVRYELYLKSFYERYRLNYAALRYFNVLVQGRAKTPIMPPYSKFNQYPFRKQTKPIMHHL